jgi:hypothetical protein
MLPVQRTLLVYLSGKTHCSKLSRAYTLCAADGRRTMKACRGDCTKRLQCVYFPCCALIARSRSIRSTSESPFRPKNELRILAIRYTGIIMCSLQLLSTLILHALMVLKRVFNVAEMLANCLKFHSRSNLGVSSKSVRILMQHAGNDG